MSKISWTTMAASDIQGDKILVKGIPSNLHPDKLTIYFQKRKIGGGDVVSVTFPVSTKEPDTAIVTFEDPKTVASVLSRNHTIGRAKLTVSALNPEPEIFDTITAQISDFTIRCIKSKYDVDDMLETVCDSTGCTVENTGDSKLAVKGKWYQVQAAFERFEAMVSCTVEKPQGDGPMPTARPQKVVVSTVIDKDIYAYMELVHGPDLADIRTKYQVSIKIKIMGEAAKVELVETGTGADPQSAIKALEQLSTKLNQTVGQDTVEIDPKFPNDELQGIFSILRPEFPMVHMDKTDSAPDHIMFIAPDNQKCKMAMDMFQYQYKLRSEARATGPSSKRDKTCKIRVETEIYHFMQLTRRANVDRIWQSNGVGVTEKVEGGFITLTCHLTSSRDGAGVGKAVAEFQNLYSKVKASSVKDIVEFKSFKPMPTKKQLVSVMDQIKSQYHTVFISSVSDADCKSVSFIASSKDQCQTAVASFKVFMESILH